MPLDYQMKQASFRYGVDEGVDPHSVPMGVLTTLENYVWLKSGRIEKRAGYTALATGILGGGNIAAAMRLFTRDNELCLVDGTNLYSYVPSRAAWKTSGTVSGASLTWGTLQDSPTGIRCSSIALAGANTLVHAWVTGDPTAIAGGNLNVEAVDATTRAKLIPFVQLNSAGTSETCSVVTLGTDAFVISKAGATIRAYPVDTAGLALRGLTNLRADAKTTAGAHGCDAVVIGNTLIICYETAANVLSLYAYTYNSATAVFTQVATGTIAEAGNTIGTISIDGVAGEVLYVGYAVSSTLKTRIAISNSTTLAAIVAPVDVNAATNSQYVGVVRYDATHCMYVDKQNGAKSRLVSNAGVIGGFVRCTPDTTPLSRPFMMSGRCFLFVLDVLQASSLSSFSGGNTMLVECPTTTDGGAPFRYVGTVDLIVGGQWMPGCLSNVIVSGSVAMTSIPFLSDGATSFSNWRCGARLVSAAFGASVAQDQWRSLSYGGESVFVDAAPAVYDGRTVFDYGFTRAPIIASKTVVAVAGKVGIGTYLYSFVQEQRSHVGILHRSPPTPPITVTLGAASTVQLFLNGLSAPCARKQNLDTQYGVGLNDAPTTVAAYRTVAGGTLPQRLTFEPTYNMLFLDPRDVAYPVSFTDGAPDTNLGDGFTTLAQRPVVYGVAGAGALDDYQSPSGVTMFYHADRIFHLAGDKRSYWFTKTFQDDFGVAPGFNPAFRLIFPDDQVCGLSMDEKGVFFSATGIKYLLGLGPAKDGTNSDFSTPIRVQTDVGCINPRSVVSTPDGIMFLSALGIYTLTRGLDVEWTGREVQDTLLAYPNVTSATLVAARADVRFTANAADGLSGVVLVYNYVEKQWSIFKLLQGSTGLGSPIADACMFQGAWTFVTPAGAVYTEGSTSLDAGAYVPGVIETAWISAAGPLAYTAVGELWLQGSSRSDHELKIEVAFNSNTTYQQTRTFHSGSPVTSVGPLEECRISIGTRRKCKSIRFRITDSSPLTPGTVLGSGAGPSFESMAITAGLINRGDDTPAGRKG